jgi:hypothetical protein
MVDASERGWGAGWPAVRSDEMVDLVEGFRSRVASTATWPV